MSRGWRDLLGVNLPESEQFRLFRGFTEARNAIVHGLGRLTNLQLAHDNGESTRSRLAEADIQVSAGIVIINMENVEEAVRRGIKLIGWLDSQQPSIA